jgi:hypothetical protein
LLEEMKRRGLLTIRVNQLMRVGADSAETMRAAVAALHLKPDEGTVAARRRHNRR